MLAIGETKVEWEPKTNRWTGAEIKATLKGAAALKGPWEDVPAGGSPGTARPTMRSRGTRDPTSAVARERDPPAAKMAALHVNGREIVPSGVGRWNEICICGFRSRFPLRAGGRL